jgi:hypothetical protein
MVNRYFFLYPMHPDKINACFTRTAAGDTGFTVDIGKRSFYFWAGIG